MAAVTVTADNVRIAEANITNDTGTWGNDGGGGGVADEPDFYYQGGSGALTSASRKISTSRIGRNYTHGSGTDHTATDRRHTILKCQATNKDALLARTAPAMGLKLGSGSSAHYEYYIFGNDNYPKRGGWQILPISPNVSGYRDATTGSPTLTSVLYWSLLADFSSTAKSENVMIDAIDIGAGLNLVGGDGASTDGVYQDFITHDEGTVGNSYGYVYTEGGIMYWVGRCAIGQNTSEAAVATEFTDSDQVLIWNNGYVETGFHRHRIDLGGTGTVISLTRCTYKSTGEENNTAGRGYTTTEDSRTIWETTGTTGTLTMTNCNIDNFASLSFNASCTLDRCNITNSGQVDAGTGADLSGSSILQSAAAADTSALKWDVNLDPDGELDDMTFTKGGNAHHAIEFGINSPLTMTVRGMTATGFNASDAQNDSTFHVLRTSGTVTINVIGGSGNFSYKSAGATVDIVIDPVTTLVNVKDNTGANLQNARVWLKAADNTGDLPFEESVTITRAGTVATVTHTAHGMNSNEYIKLSGITNALNKKDNNGAHQITVTGANTYTYATLDEGDTTYTGTIIATGALIYGLTDASGNISTSRTLSLDQPLGGFARKSSASPRFKTFPLSGTVDNVNGLTINVRLILDE